MLTTTLPPYLVHWHPPGTSPFAGQTQFDTHYPVSLTDGSTLALPLRPLPGGQKAIALLMSNQTPFVVEAALTPLLVDLASEFAPECVVAVPTMGLDYARRVAKGLGHSDYAALGLSRKFWYDEDLSESMSSSTSPTQKKSIYLDPALLSRVVGKRVVLVDDVINTGASAVAAIRLLQRAGATVAGLVVVLTEGHDWRDALSQIDPGLPERVRAVGHIPLFDRTTDGRWAPDATTL